MKCCKCDAGLYFFGLQVTTLVGPNIDNKNSQKQSKKNTDLQGALRAAQLLAKCELHHKQRRESVLLTP